MSEVSAITPVAAAASPSHPDHDRWVKEKTLKMEVEHAKVTGGTLRDAETENNRLLERMDALARTEKAPAAPRKPEPSRIVKPRKSREQRMLERAVTINKARPVIDARKLSPCGRCGTCRGCMRERRIFAIILKSKEGDRTMLKLAYEMAQTAISAVGGSGRFAHMTPEQANRVVQRKAEDICDRSVRWLGPWM